MLIPNDNIKKCEHSIVDDGAVVAIVDTGLFLWSIIVLLVLSATIII